MFEESETDETSTDEVCCVFQRQKEGPGLLSRCRFAVKVTLARCKYKYTYIPADQGVLDNGSMVF